MKKSKKLFVSLLTLAIATSCVTASIVLLNNKHAVADGETIIYNDTFNDEYGLNEVLNIPTTNNTYFLSENEKIVKAIDGEIIFPDLTSKIPGKYTLDIPGKYSIHYYGANNEVFEKEFIVNKTIYECMPGVTANYFEKMPRSQKAGVAVNLVSGSSFKINKVVNIYDFPDRNVDVINFYPLFRENKTDVPSAGYCTVKLVDAYDSSKFVEFYTWVDSNNNNYYCGAGAAFQNFTGLEYNPNRPDKINCVFQGVSYNKHVTTRYQSVEAFGVWFGSIVDTTSMISNGGISFTWDLVNNQPWQVNDNKIITDLDAVEIYDTNPMIPEEYFTTGEVYAQFECFNFNSGSMDIEIASVLGFKGDELADAIVTDTSAPTIVNHFADNIVVSKGEEFVVPSGIEVFDFNYYGDVNRSIYYNYGQIDQVSVSFDYSFTPELLGKYSLVYTARDSYGNEATKIITLNSIDKPPFEYNVKKVASLNSASENYLPKIDVVGKNGDVTVNVFAITPDQTSIELKYVDDKGYKLVPYYIGEYEIFYQLNDNFYSSSFSYKVKCNDSRKVYFDENPAIYPYYIKNASYSMIPFKGFKASSDGPIEVVADSYISIDDNSFTLIDEENEFKITGNEKVKFKFKAENSEFVSEDIDIIDVNYGKSTSEKNYSAYFEGNYSSTEEEINDIKYNFDTSANMKFANFISASKFALNYSFDTNYIENFEVRITDYRNLDNYISINVEKVSAVTFIFNITQANGTDVHSIKSYYNKLDSSTSEININASVLNDFLNITDVTSFDITNSFELGILSISSTGKTSVKISQINNQPFVRADRMNEKGVEGYYERKTGTFELNTRYHISSIIASCVLNPVLLKDVKLTVRGANDEIVKDINGVELEEVSGLSDYDIDLTDCGQYYINYIVYLNLSSFSGFNKKADSSLFFVVNVNDTIKPVVTFSSHNTLTIKVGDTIKIRSFTATDNKTKSEDLRSYVFITDDHNNLIESGYNVGSSYTFHKAGTYKITVYVYDEYGNMGSDSYIVIVK